MATPTLTKHQLPGSLGPILIDVRAGGRNSPRPAVVIVHGFKGFKDWGVFPVLAERLARAGFVAVSFNVSGSGMDDAGNPVWPDRFGHNTFSGELADIHGVIEALAGGQLGVVPPTRIGVVGHSRGGGMTILEAALNPAISALVSWAPISHVERWSGQEGEWRRNGQVVVENSRTGQRIPIFVDVLADLELHRGDTLDIRAAASRITIPWLIIHGTADSAVGLEEGQALFRASGRPTTELLPIEGGSHTFGGVHPWQGETPELRLVLDRTVAWFGRTLT